MKKQKRTITNESGKSINMMIDPENTNQHIYSRVEWNVSESQWKRICRASDGNNTTWRTERGAVIEFHCPPQKSGRDTLTTTTPRPPVGIVRGQKRG
jgi:hypothetical protein